MVTVLDRDNQLRELPVPDLSLTVAGDCGVATPTVPPTPTPTNPPASTLIPTATPGPAPRPVYLPWSAKDD